MAQWPTRHYVRGVSPILVRLREVRQAAGLSQPALSRKAHVRQATISGLETGRIQRLDLAVLDRLCRALAISPAELLDRLPRAPRR